MHPKTPIEQIVTAYDWEPGRCFRCQCRDVDTATVGHLGAEGRPVRACATCTLILERAREAAADRYGWPYRPGTPQISRSGSR